MDDECGVRSPLNYDHTRWATCRREKGHSGDHREGDLMWAAGFMPSRVTAEREPLDPPPERERDLGTLATPKRQEVLAPDIAPRAGWHPTNIEPSSGQGGLPSAEPVGSVPATPRSTAGPGVGGRTFEVGEWGWLCEDCAFFFTQDEATALKHSDERKHSLARCPKERAEARRRTHRKRRQRQRQRARQRSRISELESQLHRVLSVAAAALERAEVADDPSGAADEAAALLKQIVRLDGSYVPRDQ